MAGRPARDARHEGRASTRSCATGCSSRASRCSSIDAGVDEPVGSSPTSAATRSRARPARTWRSSRRRGDRGAAVEAMGAGAEAVVLRLHAEGRLDGVLALGGSGGSSIATRAMRALPGRRAEADGLDARLGRHAAVCRRGRRDDDVLGRRHRRRQPDLGADHGQRGRRDRRDGRRRRCRRSRAKPLVGATMFGVTTPCVTEARERLEELGYEVLVFHATGTGGQSMEALVDGGFLAGVLDVTTTELADELVGGVLSAGPDRLDGGRGGRAAAGRVARRARHGQLRPARDGAAAVRGPQPLRPQPDGDADAHDARGVPRARARDRAQALRPPRGRRRSSCRCAACR